MSLIGRALDRAGQLRRDFTGPWGHLDGSIPSPGAELGTAAGIVVTESMAMRLIAVWSCVSLITDSIASLPIGSFRSQGDVRILVDPAPSLLTSPHPEMEDVVDWESRLLLSMLLRGNTFGLVTDLDRHHNPSTVLPVHPDDVSVRRGAGGRIEYQTPDGPEYAYPAGRMWHVRGLSLPGALVGLSPIEIARQAIGLGLAVEEFGARFFGDGAHPSGVLRTDKPIKDEAKARRMVTNFTRSHGGRHRRPALLTDGVDWKPISVNPNEAQFLETRRFQRSEIASLYRVPPHMISDVEKSTSWGTGIEQQGIGFVTYTLAPWIRRLEAGISRLLPRGQFARINVAGLLRGDLKARFEAYATARQWGWLSVNDILALEDRPPLPEGGDVYLQPLNMVPAGTPLTRDEFDRRSRLVAELEAIERDVRATLNTERESALVPGGTNGQDPE